MLHLLRLSSPSLYPSFDTATKWLYSAGTDRIRRRTTNRQRGSRVEAVSAVAATVDERSAIAEFARSHRRRRCEATAAVAEPEPETPFASSLRRRRLCRSLTAASFNRSIVEVSKRQAKVRESQENPDMVMKLEAAEVKLHDLKSNMGMLGKEATAAMTAVEPQQQRLTLQRLIAMVEAEPAYHQRALQILEQLEVEMV